MCVVHKQAVLRQASMAAGVRITALFMRKLQKQAWCIQPMKFGSKRYPVLQDVSSIEYTDANKHIAVCSPLSDGEIVQVRRKAQKRLHRFLCRVAKRR